MKLLARLRSLSETTEEPKKTEKERLEEAIVGDLNLGAFFHYCHHQTEYRKLTGGYYEQETGTAGTTKGTVDN
jgi:hypothetical protein